MSNMNTMSVRVTRGEDQAFWIKSFEPSGVGQNICLLSGVDIVRHKLEKLESRLKWKSKFEFPSPM